MQIIHSRCMIFYRKVEKHPSNLTTELITMVTCSNTCFPSFCSGKKIIEYLAVCCGLVSILTIPCSLFTLQSAHYFQQPTAHSTDFTPASEVKKRISDSTYARSGSPSLSAQGFTQYANRGCLTGVKSEGIIDNVHSSSTLAWDS